MGNELQKPMAPFPIEECKGKEPGDDLLEEYNKLVKMEYNKDTQVAFGKAVMNLEKKIFMKMNDLNLLYSRTDYQPFIYKGYANYIQQLPDFETTCFENRTIKIGFYVNESKLVFAPFEVFNIRSLINRKCSGKTKFIMYFELYKFTKCTTFTNSDTNITHYHDTDAENFKRFTGEMSNGVPLKFVGAHANLLVIELDNLTAHRIDTSMPCEEPPALKEVLTKILLEYGIRYEGYYSSCKDFSEHGDLCRWVVLAQYQYRDKVGYPEIKKLILDILLNFIEEIIKTYSKECLSTN